MKSYFYKYLLLTICFLLFLNEQSVVAQTNTLYPIDLSVNIAPPYTTNLSEYSSTSGKFQLSLRRKDLYHKTWNLYVRLTLSDFAGNKCVMYSDQLSTDPKLNLIKDFQQFIKHQTCNSLIKDNGFLLEGGYTLTFEAVDRSLDKDIPLSQPVTQTIYFEQGKAPILIFPQNEEEIQCGANIINFSWQLPKIIAEQFVYRLEVVNVTNYTGAYEYAFNNPERALSVTCHTPNYTWTQFVNQILNDQQTYKFVWRVSIEDPSGNLKSTYANQGISPVYSFIYCPNKSLLWNETEDESDIVMKSKNYDDEMDVLPLQSVQKNGADIYAFWNLEPEIASKYSGVSIEYQTLGKDKWASESIIYSENSNDINTLALKLDKGLTYNVRGQYFKENEDHERIYGPYSDILQYAESNEDEEKEDCGSSLPEVKDCSEGSTLSLNVGDYISCHGTPVEITKISSGPTKNGSNWTVSGEGTLAFKFLEELKLKVKFDNIIVNCEKEFVKGEVLTIYDEKKGFVVNLNELFGKTNDGSNGSTVENVTLKNNLENPGDLKRDGNKIQMLTDDGQVVTIGEVANVNDLNYDVKQEKMSNDVECIVYFTGANTPFDNDLHNLKNILVNYYHPFDERRTYYMPYVAITNGNISEVTTSKNGDCQYVKYIMKLSDEEVIVLNEDGGKVKVPGSNTTNSSQVFAICKNQEGNYVNCGSMLISNYAMTQQELHIIPLTSDQKDKINEKYLKDYLDKIYKGLGYDYKIVIEDVLADEDEWIEKNVLKDGLKIAADDQSIWKSSTDEMKQLCTIYAQKNPAAINTQNSSYLFLVPEAEEDAYKTTSGDMPRGQSVGYIFTNVVKESEDIYHTIAHELGHGFKLEHLFDQSTKIAQGSTTNLMDYSAGNHNDLIHFQWNNMHNEHILIWPLLESDEDAMYRPWSISTSGYYIESLEELGIDDNYPFLTIDGSKVILPKTAKYICFNDGCVSSFVIDNEMWTLFVKEYKYKNNTTKKFYYYYKDALRTSMDNQFSITGREPYKGPQFNDDYVYVPQFYKDDCKKYSVHKVKYQDVDINNLNSILNDDNIIKKFNKPTINCLPESVRQFYIFMTNYYNEIKNDDDLRYRLLKILYEKEIKEVRIKGIDNNYSDESRVVSFSLESNPNWDNTLGPINLMDAFDKDFNLYMIELSNASVYYDHVYNYTNCGTVIKELDIAIAMFNNENFDIEFNAFCNKLYDLKDDNKLYCVDDEHIKKYLEFIVNNLEFIINKDAEKLRNINRFDEKTERLITLLINNTDNLNYKIIKKCINNLSYVRGLLDFNETDRSMILRLMELIDKNNYSDFAKNMLNLQNHFFFIARNFSGFQKDCSKELGEDLKNVINKMWDGVITGVDEYTLIEDPMGDFSDFMSLVCTDWMTINDITTYLEKYNEYFTNTSNVSEIHKKAIRHLLSAVNLENDYDAYEAFLSKNYYKKFHFLMNVLDFSDLFDCKKNAGYESSKKFIDKIVSNMSRTLSGVSINDFCRCIQASCFDWSKYEVIESYMQFILDESSKHSIFGLEEDAENATIYLMSKIQINDYGKFVKYLSKSSNSENFNYENLYKYLGEMDDHSINPANNNNYTRFMKQLVAMMQLNPDAFFGSLTTYDEWELSGSIVDLTKNINDAHYQIDIDKSTGKVSYWRRWSDFRGGHEEIYGNFKDVSPFTPIYFVVSEDNSASVNDIINAIGDQVKFLACPIIFMKFIQDKVSQSETKVLAELTVDVVTFGTGVGAISKARKIRNIINKSEKIWILINASLTSIEYVGSAFDMINKLKDFDNLLTEYIGYGSEIITMPHSVVDQVVGGSANVGSMANLLGAMWHSIYVDFNNWCLASTTESDNQAIREMISKMESIQEKMFALGIKMPENELDNGIYLSSYFDSKNYKWDTIDELYKNKKIEDLFENPTEIVQISGFVIISNKDLESLNSSSNSDLILSNRDMYLTSFNDGDAFLEFRSLIGDIKVNDMRPGPLMKKLHYTQLKDQFSDITENGYAIVSFDIMVDIFNDMNCLKASFDYESKPIYILPHYVIKNLSLKLLDNVIIKKYDKYGHILEKYKLSDDSKLVKLE